MRRGFTIVELIIAMSLVAVVGTVGTYLSVRGNVQRGNDARRKADLELVRSALEVYRSKSLTGEYPNPPCYSNLQASLSGLLAVLPTDPKSGQGYNYQVQLVNGKYSKYTLCAAMESSSDANGGCGLACSPTGLGCNYGVSSP